ncbi:MAG: hypothetical protein DCF31_13790 [Alphaproteobacteria bacterium]|nr:MAG: hypothetical protein DCF31_13790 [Alphaproteobacteria bacterium]
MKLITTTALLSALALGVVPAAVSAQNRDGYRDNYRGQNYDNRDRSGYGGQYARQGYYGNQGYSGGYNGGYVQPGYGGGYNNGYVQQGYGGGYYQQRPARGYNGRNQGYRCQNNNTGTIIGAIAGGLLGNSVAGRGDRLLGTVIGGGAGALVGNSIDRNGRNNRRC